MIDRVLLKALSRRDRFRALKGAVPSEMFDGNTVSMLTWFEFYFNSQPEAEEIDVDGLMTLIRLRGNLEPSSLAIMMQLTDRLREPVAQETITQALNQLEEIAFSGAAGALIARYNNNEEIDLTFELASLAQKTRKRMETSSGAKWADRDILEYLAQDNDEGGLQWTMFRELNMNLKGLRPGKNVAIAAYTDKGKTSFLCRLLVCFAMQGKTLYPDRPILYMVNEGMAETITPRVYQTALSIDRAEMNAMARAGTLVPAYEAVVGRRDHIRLVNIHGMNVGQVSRIIEAHKPYIVVTDMTGRIRANNNTSGGANDTAQLEDAWNAMRELAAMLDFAHIGTVQVSVEGKDVLYPELSALQGSKIGIQTTLDLMIMMGFVPGDAMADVRGISTPKNKEGRAGCKSLTKFECFFDPNKNTWTEGSL